MSADHINNEYLRGFFGIEHGPEGDAEIARIRSKLTRLQFSNGQDICTIDAKEDGMFFLDEGSAIVLDRDGNQINIMSEGQYFGEYAVLSGQRRLSTVRSHGRTVVYRLSSDDVMDILRRHPGIYGELMKRVYAQVSQKHRQLLSLSRMHRGVLRHPDSQIPLTPRRILIQYGLLALIFLLSALFMPHNYPVLLLVCPIVLMLVYVLFTHQTLESLIVAGLYAALLAWRGGIITTYTDALLETFGDVDNVFTVFVMMLMGSFVSLVEASGAVTAFRRFMLRKVRTPSGLRFGMLGIVAITSFDECLNMLCASGSSNASAEKLRLHCEDRSLLLSFLPTVMCSFIPISLWGIFVIGSINPGTNDSAISLFVSAIPYNFFSIVVLLAMLLHCAGKLPKSKHLKQADARVKRGGPLWPAGSEPFLLDESADVWGKASNLLIPVLTLALGSVLFRSIGIRSFTIDTACGLIGAIIVMFFLYCGQRLMSPEWFFEQMISGMQSMVLPVLLYLLPACFTSLLNQEALASFFDNAVLVLLPTAPLLPAALFLASALLTIALGSSWSMYVFAFPFAIRMATALGLSTPLFIGAVCAAGIAGEKFCVFTSDHDSVGEAIGCSPASVLSVRMPYAIAFFLISLFLYAVFGFVMS